MLLVARVWPEGKVYRVVPEISEIFEVGVRGAISLLSGETDVETIAHNYRSSYVSLNSNPVCYDSGCLKVGAIDWSPVSCLVRT